MTMTISFPASEMTTQLKDSHSVNIAMKASAARDMLRAARFDQAPAVNEEGRLCGWVRTANLGGRGFVSASLIPLERCAIQSRDTSVGDVLPVIASVGLVFFAGTKGITEFAVASDLDRHVVRCYLYLVLAETEMLLADIAESELSRETVESQIRGRDRIRYEAARSAGLETRPVEYLMISAYSRIVHQMRSVTGSFPGTQTELRSTLKELTRLRNCVAHPAKSLTTEFGAEDISRLAFACEKLTRALRAARSS